MYCVLSYCYYVLRVKLLLLCIACYVIVIMYCALSYCYYVLRVFTGIHYSILFDRLLFCHIIISSAEYQDFM